MEELGTNLKPIEEELNSKYEKNISYYIVKRILDVIGALCGILLLLPVMIVVAIMIKLDSKGTIFFTQERVGKDGIGFMMYKFRSMCTDAEYLLDKLQDKNEMTGPMFKIKEDPRVTKVGRFIRNTSIDELPQLFNILKGEMSLVGPRPSLPKEVEKFSTFQNQRLLAKPGLTCYWQVSGRSNVSFNEWMEMDVKYLEERNTWIDISLIFKTVGVLFGDDGAR
ncbi:sugar transferase [Clostridium bowmanii]|uniref:sugar transferase n=1 Tax=Clostridium bowmanii TaxID=132925 RepID=UPI001C0E43A5|nr:sugar transferase [Clostridium bowmanii]MBU3191216.1 sugar transferase [Clostridium bowmanii]MCA1075664.1 sugar transferase [Clostridium bowmanii]